MLSILYYIFDIKKGGAYSTILQWLKYSLQTLKVTLLSIWGVYMQRLIQCVIRSYRKETIASFQPLQLKVLFSLLCVYKY